MTDAPTPEALVGELVRLLDLEQLDVDLYRGGRQPGGIGRVYGGQVIAQGLQAAQRSTDHPKAAHSLHAHFMRPGSEDHAIIFRVARDFDGRSFATRRVIASQLGRPILGMTVSLQSPEDGLAHQDAMPDVPGPDGLRPEHELLREAADRIPDRLRRFLLRDRPIEFRPVRPREPGDDRARGPVQASWFRLMAPVGDDPALHRAVLAYASDMMFLGTAVLPHGVDWITGGLQTASLDHAVWLHEPFRADEWLLHHCDSPWAGHARGLNRGRVFTADGRLIASTAQEGLIRLRAGAASA